MISPPRSTLALLCVVLAGNAGPVDAQDTVNFPPRPATEQDAKLLSGPNYAAVKQELMRMGLHQTLGHTCRTFITADSIRPIETPLPLEKTRVTLPYASFLVWSADRPYRDAVLYHIFTAAEAAYATGQTLPPGTAGTPQAFTVKLAPREPYPSAADAARKHEAFANGPFSRRGATGGAEQLEVKPYVLPTENDDPASVLPGKDEHTLQVTCLSDPGRVENCLCAGTE